MHIRKFEFPSKAVAIELLGDTEQSYLVGSPPQPVIPNQVHFGHIELTPAVMDGDEVVTEAVLSDKYHVDVLFEGEVPEDLEPYAVWPAPPGIHAFDRNDGLYEADYQQHLANQ